MIFDKYEEEFVVNLSGYSSPFLFNFLGDISYQVALQSAGLHEPIVT